MLSDRCLSVGGVVKLCNNYYLSATAAVVCGWLGEEEFNGWQWK